jgi:hypothetical protein
VPYLLILLLAAVVLGVRYLAIHDASLSSKIAVATIVAASLVIWWQYPQWTVVDSLLQLGICIYVLLYIKLNPDAS